MFFQGSCGWLSPGSSLLFVCMFSFVPSHTACPGMLADVALLPSGCWRSSSSCRGAIYPSAGRPGPGPGCLGFLVAGVVGAGGPGSLAAGSLWGGLIFPGIS